MVSVWHERGLLPRDTNGSARDRIVSQLEEGGAWLWVHAARLFSAYALALVVLLLAVVAVQAVYLWIVSTRAARRMKRHQHWGQEAERRARKLLERGGYRIVTAQAGRSYQFRLDGRPCQATVRADFLVHKGGETFVAEVKAGEESAKLNRATRRQLLEYTWAFRVQGVLLLDMHAQRIVRVHFPDA